jgi:hypothetical protein
MIPDLVVCSTSLVGMCNRGVLNGINYCCRPCREAHVKATKNPDYAQALHHSEECNSRHKKRGDFNDLGDSGDLIC